MTLSRNNLYKWALISYDCLETHKLAFLRQPSNWQLFSREVGKARDTWGSSHRGAHKCEKGLQGRLKWGEEGVEAFLKNSFYRKMSVHNVNIRCIEWKNELKKEADTNSNKSRWKLLPNDIFLLPSPWQSWLSSCYLQAGMQLSPSKLAASTAAQVVPPTPSGTEAGSGNSKYPWDH